MIDASFFGKRSDKFGLIVAKDVEGKEPIAYNFIETETKEVYRDPIRQIDAKGYRIQAVILDGKPGIFGLFEEMQIQFFLTCLPTLNTRNSSFQLRPIYSIDGVSPP